MKNVLFLACLSCFLHISIYADVTIEVADPNNRDHDGHCYTKKFDLGAFKKLERKQIPGQCQLAECRADGNVAFASCGKVSIEAPCSIVPGDPSQPYPDCCFQIKCYFEDST